MILLEVGLFFLLHLCFHFLIDVFSPTTSSYKLLSQRSSPSEPRNLAHNLLTYPPRPSSIDVQFVDFDGVRFRLSTPERKTQLLLSMSIRCWDELVHYGANDIINREYGQYVAPQVEPQYNVSLQLDIEKIPPEGGAFASLSSACCTHRDCAEARDALIKSISLLKRNALAAPFERAFQAQKSLESEATGDGDLMAIHYRDEEAIYVQAAHDRVTVVFSTVFREETDRIFGKVFLQVNGKFLLPHRCLMHLLGIRRCQKASYHTKRTTSSLFESRSPSRDS